MIEADMKSLTRGEAYVGIVKPVSSKPKEWIWTLWEDLSGISSHVWKSFILFGHTRASNPLQDKSEAW